MKLEDLNDDDYQFRGLLKGEPSTGKSIFAASLPEPIYIFDLDRRMRSVANYYHGLKKDINFETFDRTQLVQLADKVESLGNGRNYATVVMDSLTFLSDMIMSDMMRQKQSGGTKRNAEGGEKGKRVGRFEVPVLEDFGGEAAILTQIITALCSLTCNFALTAHVVSSSTNKTNKRPLLTGGSKIAAKIPGLFDEKYHFFVELDFNPENPPRFKIRTLANGDDWAGTAMNLPVEIDITNIGRRGNPGGFELIRKLHTKNTVEE